jgi:uncharacterized protein YcbK (DUF882 family)
MLRSRVFSFDDAKFVRRLLGPWLFGLLALTTALGAGVPDLAQADRPDACQARRRRARRTRLTAAQRRAIRRRHAASPRSAVTAWLRLDPPPLVLRPARGHEGRLTPTSDRGGFDAEDLAAAARALANHGDGAEHPIEPRLVELIYSAVRHFRTPWVTVISGYRPDRATSRHAHGRAIDLVLPGVSDRRVAAWARRQGFVGVGIYPTSGFVHIDVREHSYFWSDSSGPGEETRERPMLRSQWTRADRDARRRGVAPTSDDVIREARAAAERAREEAGAVDAEGGEGSPPAELLEEAETEETSDGEADPTDADP